MIKEMYIWELNSKDKEPPNPAKDFYTEEENEKMSYEFGREMSKILSPVKENPQLQGNF